MLEYRTGHMDLFYRNAGAIMSLPAYNSADLLHYHIVHEKWLSSYDWRRLSRSKPVVWTWHDPYFLTGHCIYPMDCTGYQHGCPTCPNLEYHFPIRRDCARKNLHRKAKAITHIDPLVVVASDYMEKMVRRSIYGDSLRVRVVPFGIEWENDANPLQARQALGISPNHVVIGFRAVRSDYKGLPLIQAALARLSDIYRSAPITLIAFQEKGTLKDLSSHWQLIETGWIADQRISQYYAAMDFFLMPSRAEAFGMMAIEALAAGALPIVTYGTALPELVLAPLYGIATDHSIDGLTEALFSAIRNARRWEVSRAARKRFAADRYSMSAFAANLTNVYNEQYEYFAGH